MPSAAKGTVAVKPVNEVHKKEEEREVLYPQPLIRVLMQNPPEKPDDVELEVWQYRSALTCDDAKMLLEWETEDDYCQRRLKENAKMTPGELRFGDQVFTLRDEHNDRVACWNNGKNRPFDESWARRLSQDILTGHWRLNLETIIIGKTGLVLSGQHRLIALILACQMWEQDKERWKDVWPEQPTIQTALAIGAEETQDTVNTFDETKARTDGDTLYTSGIFDGWTVKDKAKGAGGQVTTRSLGPAEKKECARMLATATNFLWNRTGAGAQEGHKYKTHSELASFRDRHPKLLACVKHIFEENANRAISVLRLSPGECAAMCYLQGSAESKPDEYRDLEPLPGEAALSWATWDRATQFWVELAGGKLKVATDAIGSLYDADNLSGGRATEKACVLAKAWGLYVQGKKPAEKDLKLNYNVDPDTKQPVLDEFGLGFGGIDRGLEKREQAGEGAMSEAQLAKKKEDTRAQAAADLKKQVDDARTAKLQQIGGVKPPGTKPAAIPAKPVAAKPTAAKPQSATPTKPAVAANGNAKPKAAVATKPAASPTKPKGLSRTV